MTNFKQTTLALALSVFGLVGGAQTVQAGPVSYHLDDLALQLQRQSQQLYWEFRNHYSHTPSYRHLISDASEMYQLSAHVHEVAHHGGSPAHLQADLQKLDRLFHHVEDLVRDIERNHGHPWHGGHIHGDTRHVRRILASMEDTLHHMLHDVTPAPMVRPVPRAQAVPPLVPRSSRSGVIFNGRGFSVQIGR